MHSTIALALLVAAVPHPGGDKQPADAPAGRVEKIDALRLTLIFPDAFAGLKPAETKVDQIRAAWTGRVGKSSFSLALYALPYTEFAFGEPEDVADLARENFRRRDDASFAYDHTELVTGTVGWAPLASLGWGAKRGKDGKAIVGGYYMLGGLLEKNGYALEFNCEPALDAANEKHVLDFLRKGVSYKGTTRNAQWTDAEAKARWLADAPEKLAKKMEKTVRTKHYIFLSNCGSAKRMGDEMEIAYDAIQAMYPFDEVEGRRLLPVFLFTSQTQYYEFYAKAFKTTVEEAAQSKGVAARDFYATYYDAPQDPVHIHEMTHQIFGNRLRLGGGGSWFQEGVAEYICTKPSDRTDAVNLVKKEKHTKLASLIAIESLIAEGANDKKKSGEANSLYTQAAVLIEFLRESAWSKDKFLDWVHAVGNCPPNNQVAIERATKAVLGVDIAGLEAKYVEYCKKR